MKKNDDEKKLELDAYMKPKIKEICLDLEHMFPNTKSSHLKGGFCFEMLLQLSEEDPVIFSGIASAVDSINKRLIKTH